MLKNEINQLIKNIVGEKINFGVSRPPKNMPFDLATNAAIAVARLKNTSPMSAAEKLAKELRATKIFSAVEVASPGFINLRFNWDFLWKQLEENERNFLTNLARNSIWSKKKILLEFVSANPTGPLHIGHGRGAALGDSLGRILAAAGAKVVREYYVNDAGNQIDNLTNSVLGRIQQLLGESKKFCGEYQGEYLLTLAKKILQETKNPEASYVRHRTVDLIIEEISHSLNNFGVHFDNWVYESSLLKNNNLEKNLAELSRRGLLEEKDGALWFKSSRLADTEDRVLRRRDGRFTYFATDILYHRQKLQRGFDYLINLWGADHHGYVARLRAAIAGLKYPPQILQIVLYNLVTLKRAGKVVAMSTRTGEFITLDEVVKEIGQDVLQQRGLPADQQTLIRIGRDICRFFFVFREPTSPLEFDLDLAKKQSAENPIFYIQYAHARICSIFHQAEKQAIARDKARIRWEVLNEPERKLILQILSFADTVLTCAEKLSPHYLANYLIDTVREFHTYYDTNRVLGNEPEITLARLALLDQLRKTIATGLNLLGISAPEKM